MTCVKNFVQADRYLVQRSFEQRLIVYEYCRLNTKATSKSLRLWQSSVHVTLRKLNQISHSGCNNFNVTFLQIADLPNTLVKSYRPDI